MVCFKNSNRETKPINADPKTTVALPFFYIKDKSNIMAYRYYVGGNYDNILDSIITIPYSESSEITVYDHGFLKVGNTIYFEDQKNEEIDASSFELIGGIWAKDKDHVIYGYDIMKDIDVHTFGFDEKLFQYTDKDYIYEFDKDGLQKKSKK